MFLELSLKPFCRFQFQANNNEIEDWNDVYVLEKCTKLETVYLEKNPLQTKFQEQYRRRIMAVLPNLKQIDATYTRSGMWYLADIPGKLTSYDERNGPHRFIKNNDMRPGWSHTVRSAIEKSHSISIIERFGQCYQLHTTYDFL